jgi:uncharacterized protein YuzE
MKKLLGILVMVLWCDTSFDNIDDLDIPITKAEFETEVIKPNKEYRQSCEADVTIEGYDLVIKANSYIDVTGKKQTLVNEIIFDIGEDGKIITKYKQKIKSDGTLSKVKASSDYIPGSVEYSKKEIKQVKKTFKSMAQFFDKRVLNYGEKATPGINRTDETKEFIKILKLMESLFRDEDPKEVKEFINMAKKDMEFKMVKEYLGTTELYGEKFYAIRLDSTLKYVGDIAELKEVFEALSSESVYFIHAPSGYTSAFKTIDTVSVDDDLEVEIQDNNVCTIYKNDQVLIEEVSLSELEAYAVAEKVEPTQTDDGNNITQQLKDLKELYDSGALTEEEYKKAKKKLLN